MCSILHTQIYKTQVLEEILSPPRQVSEQMKGDFRAGIIYAQFDSWPGKGLAVLRVLD